ncbi:MAG: ABC transporter substrate-binding protein [Calditrichaceae bacterium]
MQKRILLIIMSAFLIIQCAGEQKNDGQLYPNGKKVPDRIISLSPNITEIVYALGLEDKLVAVTDFCDYPADARQKEKVGGLLNPNLEKIVSLKPDLIIGPPSYYETAEKLSAQGIRSLLLPMDKVNEIYSSIDSIGRVCKSVQRAENLNQAIRDSIKYYNSKIKELAIEMPSAMLVLGREPGTTRNISVLGPGSFIDEIWEGAGAINSFADMKMAFAQVNREAVITRKPELIIEFKFKDEWNDQKNRQNLEEWSDTDDIPAVLNKQIYVLTGDYTLIPGPRTYQLVKDFYLILNKYRERKAILSGKQ